MIGCRRVIDGNDDCSGRDIEDSLGIDAGVADLDLFEVAKLDFEKPDLDLFPCLAIAAAAAKAFADSAAQMAPAIRLGISF